MTAALRCLLTIFTVIAAIVTPTESRAVVPANSVLLFPHFAGACGGLLVCAGDASVVGTTLRLVPSAPDQAGAAYFAKLIPLSPGQGFVSAFTFRLSGSVQVMNADGIAFVLARDPTSLGDPSRYGGSMGFEGVTQSFAVEFDTFDNGQEVGGNNHIALDRNGVLSDTAAASPFGQSACSDGAAGPNCMSNGELWTGIIAYNGQDHELSVAMMNGQRDIDLVIDAASVNLDNLLGGTGVYAGFSAGTGDGHMNHDITSWGMAIGNPNLHDPKPTQWMQTSQSLQNETDIPEPASATLLALGLAALAGAARRRR